MKDPREVVSPGDRVQVRVLEISLEKNQIALTMRSGEVRAESKDFSRDQGRSPGKPTPGKPAPTARPIAQKPKEAFNNAFAGLAGLRNSLKK
ncbi:hypothetical protein EBZ37_12915 [bacterium]|nr:hypothetical protein [bacterium]